MGKSREELEKEYAEATTELGHYQHKQQRLENRIRYYTEGERKKRNHRLIICVVILSAVDRQRRKIPPGVTAFALNIHKDSAARKVFLSMDCYLIATYNVDLDTLSILDVTLRQELDLNLTHNFIPPLCVDVPARKRSYPLAALLSWQWGIRHSCRFPPRPGGSRSAWLW